MKPLLKELSEILKINPAIKERLERLEFGCWIKEWERVFRIIYDIWVKNTTFFCINLWDERYWPQMSFNPKDYPEYNIIGREPQYSDILEYFGEAYSMDCELIYYKYSTAEKEVKLSPWPLSEQSDSTLDEIIYLCKNVWNK